MLPLGADQESATAVYVFYLCAYDGAHDGVVAFEMASDRQAVERAAWLLAEHPGAPRVAAWQGNRQIRTGN